MLRLDPNDPLDRMIIQELKGDPVLFDQWLDAMDELSEEPDELPILLQERGLSREDVLREAEAYRTEFRTRLAARGLPIENWYELCRLLHAQSCEDPSPELLYLYCELLSNPDFLLNLEPELEMEDEEDKKDVEDQLILQYLKFPEERDRLLELLSQRKALADKLAQVIKEKRSPKPVDCDTERRKDILESFIRLVDLPPKGNKQILEDNLSAYMQIAAASPALKSIEPLFLFRLLTKRRSYMCSTPNLEVKLPALWKADQTKVDEDNGRNFRQYAVNLVLFAELCKIYGKDETVDLPLCWYGLDQITVLGEFYRDEVEPAWLDSDEELIFQFLPTAEELVDDAVITRLAQDSKNLMLEESGLSDSKLEKFRRSSNPLIVKAFDKISDYMNQYAVELTKRFLTADSSAVKTLCGEILERSEPKHIPEQKIPLFLAAINEGLLELEDQFAHQHLVSAGSALTDAWLIETLRPTE